MQSLVKAGEIRRSEAEATVQTLLERGREAATRLAEIVQAEVARQLGWLANRVDDVEDQLEGFVSRFGAQPGGRAGRGHHAERHDGAGGRSARRGSPPAKKSTAKKSHRRRSAHGEEGRPAKKSTAKKSTAKKSTAKKSTAKKKAVGTSGVRKVATTRTG